MSAATPEATAAGVRVLALGGNAVDAAVATALVLGVTEPSESGLGGRAVLLVTPPGSDAEVIHGGEPATLDSGSGGPPLAAPTALAVLGAAWERHGSGELAWRDLVEPAIRAAEEGWALGRYRHRLRVREYPRFLRDSATAALLLNPDRSIPTEGSRVANPALAATLRAVAEEGPSALTGGSLAASLAEALEARGYAGAAAWLSRPAEVTVSEPARGSYRGHTVLTAPEPYGGPAVLRALSFLERAPPAVLEEAGLARTVWMAEALGWAASGAADAEAFLEGAPPLPIVVEDTVPEEAETVSSPRRGGPPPGGGTGAGRSDADITGGGRRGEPDETTHLSVVDGDGMAVALTLSLGQAYGAAFLADGLGFFPGVAQATGSEQADARWWAAPTVLLEEGRPSLVLGSPGGRRGVAAVVQVIAGWPAGTGSLQNIVEARRIHVEPDSVGRYRLVPEGVVWMDSTRSSPRVLAPFGDTLFRPAILERGVQLGEHDEGPLFQDWDPWFGGVHAVARTEEGWEAAADPRRDGEGRSVTEEDIVEATGEAPRPQRDGDVRPESGEGAPPPGRGG